MSLLARFKNQPEAAVAVEDAQSLPDFLLLGNLWTRVFSAIALIAMLAALGYGLVSAVNAFRDSFVAPIILSPDSDMVIQNKLNLSRLLAERQSLLARMDENKAAIDADDKAIEQLGALQQNLGRALDWTTNVTGRQAAYGRADLAALQRQEQSIRAMIVHQEKVVTNLKRDLAGGLIRKTDVERETNALNQLQISLVQNGRDQSTANLQLQTAALAQKALSGPDGKVRGTAPLTPEMISQREQSVRIELDLLKHESDRRAKNAQIRTDGESLAKIDELLGQMKERPIFRAMQSKQNVAFVPYTQMEGVVPGANVYDCKWWGLFACDYAGKVAEVLPGEVVAQDPWGTVTRGQYAIMALADATAAQSKTLRIRPPWTWNTRWQPTQKKKLGEQHSRPQAQLDTKAAQ